MSDSKSTILSQTCKNVVDLMNEVLTPDVQHGCCDLVDGVNESQIERLIPLVSAIEGATMKEFKGDSDVIERIAPFLSKDLIHEIKNGEGVSISFSDDSPLIKETLLEVLSTSQLELIASFKMPDDVDL